MESAIGPVEEPSLTKIVHVVSDEVGDRDAGKLFPTGAAFGFR